MFIPFYYVVTLPHIQKILSSNICFKCCRYQVKITWNTALLFQSRDSRLENSPAQCLSLQSDPWMISWPHLHLVQSSLSNGRKCHRKNNHVVLPLDSGCYSEVCYHWFHTSSNTSFNAAAEAVKWVQRADHDCAEITRTLRAAYKSGFISIKGKTNYQTLYKLWAQQRPRFLVLT